MRFTCPFLLNVMSTFVLICFYSTSYATQLEINPQSILNGTQHSHVNLSKGNLTFATTDLHLVNRLPIEIKRIYDSSYDTSDGENSPLGFGWHLNYAESITPISNQHYVYLDDNANRIKAVRKGKRLYLPLSSRNNVELATFDEDGDTITLNLTNGWLKTFVLIGSRFRLKTITDNNNNQLILDYQANKLTSITATNQQKISFYYNQANLISHVRSSSGQQIEYNYKHSHLANVQTPYARFLWEYHYQGQKIRHLSHRNGFKARFDYDENQRIKWSEIEEQQLSYEYGHRTTKVTGLQSIDYQHHSSGITTFIHHGTIAKQLKLNQQLKVSEVLYNGNKIASYRYTPNHNLKLIEHFNHQQQDYALHFNASGQINRIVMHRLGANQSDSYLYDHKRNLVLAHNNGDYNHFGYSHYGDLISHTKNGSSITFRHNIKGQIRQANSYSNGQLISAYFNYDKNDYLIDTMFSNFAAKQLFAHPETLQPINQINRLAQAKYQLSDDNQIQHIIESHRLMLTNHDVNIVNVSYLPTELSGINLQP